MIWKSLVAFLVLFAYVQCRNFKLDNCFFIDKDYYGGDIGARCEKRDSYQECQKLCQNTDGCGKFSYVTDKYNGIHGPNGRRGCCLKQYGHQPLTDEVGVISGPKICSEFVACNFAPGDGTGGVDEYIGKSINPSDCVNKCKLRKRRYPTINGVTVDAKTGTSCYCEHFMTSRNSVKSWKSCIFTSRVPRSGNSRKDVLIELDEIGSKMKSIKSALNDEQGHN